MRLIELVDRRYLPQWIGAGWEASALAAPPSGPLGGGARSPRRGGSGAKVLVERRVADAEEAAAAVARARGLER